MARLVHASRVERDLRALAAAERHRVRRALELLVGGAENLDVRPLVGRDPWLRLRVGDYRILLRPLSPDEIARLGETRRRGGYLIARVIHRRDLDRAVRSL